MPNRRNLLKGIGAAAGVAVGAAVVEPAAAGNSAPPVPKKRALILLDKSGSMAIVRQATVDGLNAFLDEQRDKPDLFITLLQFDAPIYLDLEITETFVDVPADKTPNIKLEDFQPRGNTPLRSAVVAALDRLEKLSGPDDKLLFVVQTDGDDTASPREISKSVVKELVEAKQKLGNWTIVFLGADIDAWGEGGAYGVAAGNTIGYANTYGGTVANYATTSASTQTWYDSGSKATVDFFNQPNEIHRSDSQSGDE